MRRVVLDLDETLIHTPPRELGVHDPFVRGSADSFDWSFVDDTKRQYKGYTYVRPGYYEFLATLIRCFGLANIHVFTAGKTPYAEAIVKHIFNRSGCDIGAILSGDKHIHCKTTGRIFKKLPPELDRSDTLFIDDRVEVCEQNTHAKTLYNVIQYNPENFAKYPGSMHMCWMIQDVLRISFAAGPHGIGQPRTSSDPHPDRSSIERSEENGVTVWRQQVRACDLAAR